MSTGSVVAPARSDVTSPRPPLIRVRPADLTSNAVPVLVWTGPCTVKIIMVYCNKHKQTITPIAAPEFLQRTSSNSCHELGEGHRDDCHA